MLTVLDPLETPRLVLRGFLDSDVDSVHRFASDPEVVRYLPWQVRSRREVQSWVADRMAATNLAADGDGVAYAVQRRTDGVVIGAVNAWWRSVEHQQGEVGYVLARDAQGQGYVTPS